MADIEKYNYISRIIAYMETNEYTATIKSMSYDLAVPIPFMRHSILALLKNEIIRTNTITCDFRNYDDSEIMDELIDEPNIFTQNLLSGKYDDMIWNLNLNDLSDEENIILSLSQIENSALASIGCTPVSLKRSALFEKKDSIKPISSKIRKIQTTIQDAIETGSTISFIYTTRDGKEQAIKCLPQRLITNVTDNWIYLMNTSSPYPIRLDRIKYFHGIIDNDGSYPGPKPNEMEKYYWGTSSNTDEGPIHVKLRIAAETRNIISKIKSDISFRSETCKFYQMDDFYYYEDDIIGIFEFQRWIRAYGSSIIVIEPKSLKDNIVERAKETLKLYEASESWGDL